MCSSGSTQTTAFCFPSKNTTQHKLLRALLEDPLASPGLLFPPKTSLTRPSPVLRGFGELSAAGTPTPRPKKRASTAPGTLRGDAALTRDLSPSHQDLHVLPHRHNPGETRGEQSPSSAPISHLSKQQGTLPDLSTALSVPELFRAAMISTEASRSTGTADVPLSGEISAFFF